MIKTGLLYVFVVIMTLLLLQVYKMNIRFGKVVLHQAKRVDVFSVVLTSLPLILVMSLRYGIGTDYFSYSRMFDRYISGASVNTELGFSYLLSISNYIFGDFQGFIFVTSCITIIPIVIWILNMKDNSEAWRMIIVFCIYFGMWQNGIRQSIAMSISVFALEQIVERNFKKFILTVIIASLFHTSALILVPCYFLIGNNENENKKSLYILKYIIKYILAVGVIIIGWTLYSKYAAVLGLPYSNYLEVEGKGISRNFLRFSLMLFIPELFFMKKMILKDKKNELFYLLGLTELIFSAIGMNVAYLYRLSQYFWIVHVYLIPEIGNIFKSRKIRLIWNVAMTALVVFRFVFLNMIRGYDEINVYQSVLGL